MPHLAFDPIDVDAFGGIGGGGVDARSAARFPPRGAPLCFRSGRWTSDIAVLDWRHFRGLLIGAGVVKIFLASLPRLSARIGNDLGFGTAGISVAPGPSPRCHLR